MPRLTVCYIVHDDAYYLAQSIASFKPAGDVLVFVSRVPWHEQPGDWEATARIAQEAGAEVVLGEWTSELTHRQAAFQYLLDHGYTHALIPDGDEIIEPRLLHYLLQIAEVELADRVHVHWDTYWKSPEYLIRPREPFTPLILLDLRAAHPVGGRDFEDGRLLVLSEDYGLIHHLSYVGPDERILRKIRTWGHWEDVVEGWYEAIWQRWDRDKLLTNLHPTHPPAYGKAERIPVPDILQPSLDRYRVLSGETKRLPLPRPSVWPKVSVIIPLHGGVEEIRACLDSLERCSDLLQETIVVDNASPDGAEAEAEVRSWVQLLRHETNQGFAIACNQGAAAATGDVLLFLNSDTVVPRCALLRLIEALMKSGSIAATGPHSNFVGHFQQITPTYSSLATLDLFAEEFARRPQEDVETDMLVGFCLAVRRSVWEEVGGFDEQFRIGTYEDTDLCYRMRRAGYRLRIASRSFVHHAGSTTLTRVVPDVRAHMMRNEAQYRKKWLHDLETGYASNLSGLTGERIVFDPSRHPEVRAQQVAEWAQRADISLCMIVRDEERVLGDALASAKPFFSEIIVVDTGSTDRTVEIAHEHGAKVFHFPWTDSFSEARNESLKHARGKWIFWLDADDTLPWSSGEALLQAAMNAPKETSGFVVPVQFVEDGTRAAGTRVDHVKLFRNLPGLAFEGRIHEQILPSLRAAGGQIARCEALVLHSGYDSSPQGQARKRDRDLKLLALDLQDRPNHPFVLFNLGMTYHYLGEHQEAIRWFRLCLQYSGAADSHVRKAYALLAISLRETQQPEACLAMLEEGLLATPEDPELHFHLGHTLTTLGRYAEAKAHYLQTLEADITTHFSSVDIGILGFKTQHNLGGICYLLDHYREAREWWGKALEGAPQFLPTVFEWFNAALESGDTVSAHRLLQRVQEAEGWSENWATIAARYAELIGDAESADDFLRQQVAVTPTHVGIRLVLVRRLLQNGREREAQEHLRLLDTLGVAEATYCLGVGCIRHGDLEEALGWMQRAQRLNPNHAETQAQILHLSQALGRSTVPSVPSLSLEEAVAQVAADLGLDAEALLGYVREDTVGGYGIPGAPSATKRWPGGSVWEEEGQLLYALVRALKPTTMVEVGSKVGCSSSHLARACCRNGQGTVTAIDPALDFSGVDPALKAHLVEVKADIFEWTPPGKVDFLFEDGEHSPGFTRRVLQRLAPFLQPGALVLSHDVHQAQFGKHLATEFREVMGESARSVLIAPSDCGLGYAAFQERKAPARILTPLPDAPPPRKSSLSERLKQGGRADGNACVELPPDTPLPERLNRLRKAHPYPKQKPRVPPNDHGWLQEQTAQALAQPLSEATRIIVELGSWLGRSTRFLANHAPNATIIAVDHWLGSAEQQANPEWRALLPTLYETFCVNCWASRQRIIPMRLSTLEGMEQIALAGIIPDVIYVDAAHDYESVRQDVEMALRLFPRSVLVGDDWNTEGVQQGVLHAVLAHQREAGLSYNLTAWWLNP